MVVEEKIKGQTYFKCGACGFYYKNREIAQKCEDYCNKYSACSLEITKHAVKI